MSDLPDRITNAITRLELQGLTVRRIVLNAADHAELHRLIEAWKAAGAIAADARLLEPDGHWRFMGHPINKTAAQDFRGVPAVSRVVSEPVPPCVWIGETETI